MGEDFSHPQLFANHVISQMVEHSGGDLIVEYDDFMVMRVVFRRLGGSWSALTNGDLRQLELLKSIVKTWCQMPGRVKETDRLI